jgi:site-specific recombinase XerD
MMRIENPNDWDKKRHRTKDPSYQYNGVIVSAVMSRYMSAFTKTLVLMENLTRDNVSEFKVKLFTFLNPEDKAGRLSAGDLIEFYEKYNKVLKAKRQSNYMSYHTCLSHLLTFRKNKCLPFDSVDFKFFEGFIHYLTKKNLSLNHIATMISRLKAVMQRAHSEGLHTNTQFKDFKKRMESTDSIYLTEEELNKIYKLNLTGYLDKARDYFLIGSYTGLRFEDWDRVSNGKVVNGVLKVRSTKTGEVSTIPIHPIVSAILDKYEGELPHKPSNQKMNEYIKVVAMRANINDHVETRITKGGIREINTNEKHELVTTHTARRSLATNLVLRGVSPYVVMKVTGHKSLSSFERYVRLQELEAMMELKSLSFFQ